MLIELLPQFRIKIYFPLNKPNSQQVKIDSSEFTLDFKIYI